MKKHPISLKLILLISTGLLGLLITASQFYYSERILGNFINETQQKNIVEKTTILDGLYEQWFHKTIEIGGVLSTSPELRRSITTKDITSLTSLLKHHGEVLMVESGISKIQIIDDQLATIATWETEKLASNEIPSSNLRHTLDTLQPSSYMSCAPSCIHFTIFPLTLNKNQYIIVVGSNYIDVLMSFEHVVGEEVRLNTRDVLIDSNDEQILTYLTPSAFPIPSNYVFTIQNDISFAKNTIYKFRNKNLIFSTLCISIFVLLILYILLPPVNRLTKTVSALPYLADFDFESFRKSLSVMRKSRQAFELDILDINIIDLSYRLESLVENLNVRSDVASNIPGAIFQFKVLTYNTLTLNYISDGISSMIGYSPKELTGNIERIFRIIHPDDMDKLTSSINNCVEEKSRWTCIFRVFSSDGEIHWISGSSSPINNTDTVNTWNGILLDITPLKVAENEKEKAVVQKLRIEESTAIKNQLFSNISHEIRTPLNSIVNLSHLLYSNENISPSELNTYSKAINYSSQHLLTLVNNVLEKAKFDTNKITIHKNETNIKNVLISISSMLDLLAAENNNTIQVIGDDKLPEILIIDEIKFRQIMINLVSNAIKFSKNSDVLIIYELLSKDANSVNIRFSVVDHGNGLTETEISNLFTRYQTLDNPVSHAGTGLGLAISKELVNLLGGEIGVKSKKGEGAEFWFNLNMKIPSSFRNRSSSMKIKTAKIMLIDDDKLGLFSNTKLLNSFGHSVNPFDSPIEALTCFDDAEYDIIICDYHMDFLNGLEFIDAIRKRSTIPVILYTADQSVHVSSETTDVTVVIKPSDPQYFNAIINSVINNNINDVVEEKQNLGTLDTLITHLNALESLHEFQNIYVDQVQSLSNELQNSLLSNNQILFLQIIHKLKSNAGMVGDKALLTLLDRLDLNARSDFQSIGELLHKVQIAIEKSIETVSEHS